ncbi:MAG: DUF6443 domain-containing protein [Bacteroides sp.]|nr:DUF6443 domain-containing protein [Bacteroides sp.]
MKLIIPIKYISLLILLWLTDFCPISAQSQKDVYITTIIPKEEVTWIGNISDNNILVETQYHDGLGRPVQVVQRGISPEKKDVIRGTTYDAYGREYKFIPPAVVKTGGAQIPESTLQNYAMSTYGDSSPVAEFFYDDSPLNRPIKESRPGSAWKNADKAIRTEYLTNSTTDANLTCMQYTVNTSTYAVAAGTNYAAGELYVVKTTDEDGKVSYTFTDKQEKIVLQRRLSGSERFDTYYLYDEYDNLVYVLPPAVSGVVTTANLDLYAYGYKYDTQNRCTEKKLPGCTPVKYVYDQADRVVFSQDGNQAARSSAEWTFYLYDVFGRQVLQGTCANTNTSSASSVVVTASFTASNSGIGNSGYTSNFTLTNPVVERICYYDDCRFRALTGFTDATHFPVATVDARGLLTGQVHILSATGTRLCEAFYYDAKARPVRHVAGNHLGGYDKTVATYTFTGKPVTITRTHTATGKTTQTEVYTHIYDHAERLTRLTHKLNSQATVTLAEHTYDEVGRLKTKTNHSSTVHTATYAYNVRDWITAINGSKFSQNLYYNTGSGTPLYSGNISSMTWRAGTETTTRGYKFAYDGLDRLTTATYGEGTSISTNPNRFDEKVTLYDKNGNIKKLEQRGKTSTTAYGVIDNLTFTHTGNQLLNVSDAATDPTYAGNFNFVDGNKGTGTEYIWDKNGNLVQDYNKQIANISYNSLNLPVKLQFRQGHTAEYLYDASGVKRQVKHTTTNQNLSVGWGSFKEITAAQKASEKVTDYCGGVIYENGVLKMILTPEGYITLSGTTPTYHYYLRDHLGNNRVVVNQSGTVTQVNHYYPFGGLFGEGTATSDQPYKYNDKGLDRTNGLNMYDYSARYMDAALGQFTTVDPLAEKNYSISPYANNSKKSLWNSARGL